MTSRSAIEYREAVHAYFLYPQTGETPENASLLCNLDSIIPAAGRTDADFRDDLRRLSIIFDARGAN